MGFTKYEWVNMSILQNMTFLITPSSQNFTFGHYWVILGINGLTWSLWVNMVTNGLTWSLMGYALHHWVNMSILLNLTCQYLPWQIFYIWALICHTGINGLPSKWWKIRQTPYITNKMCSSHDLKKFWNEIPHFNFWLILENWPPKISIIFRPC